MVHKLAQQQFHFFYSTGSLKMQVEEVCVQERCVLYEIDWSRRPHIFLTSQSGVGDERGWDFIAGVSTAKSSLTSFSNDVTRIYRTNYPISPP